MKKNTIKLLTLSMFTSLAIGLVGCGDDSEFTHKKSVEAIGKFIDSPVANLDVYQNGKKISTTNSEGKFTYMTGSDLTFKLGNIILGSTIAKNIVTPADLSDDTNKVVDILQVLQSLDEDKKLENGIFIPQTIIDKLVTVFNPLEDNVSIIDAVKTDIPELELVNKQDAINHFSQSQETIKTSDDLSKVADNFVGYWQQSCENGNQQVFELSKDSLNPNILVQTGQFVNREYDNNVCTGTYNETMEYSTNDPLTVKIMGTIYNEDSKLVVNALRTEGSNTFFDSLIMSNNDEFSSDDLIFSRNSSLAFDDDVNSDDDPELEAAKNKLVGYWKSTCDATADGSKIYYINLNKQGDGSLISSQSLRETFATNNCTGNSEVTYNDTQGYKIPDSDIIAANFNGNNQFVTSGDMPETYNRILESAFPTVTQVNPIENVEDAVNTMVGYWKSECLSNDKTVEHMEIIKVNSSTVKVNTIEELYGNNSCSGKPIQTINKVETIDFNQDKDAIPDSYSKNRLVVDYINEYGVHIVEVYNRIEKSKFESIAVEVKENKTVPEVIDVDFKPASGRSQAYVEVTFNTDMSNNYYTTGSYSPSNSYWTDSKNFIVEFDSYMPGGTIKFAGYSEQGEIGFINSSGLVMQNDYTFTFPN